MVLSLPPTTRPGRRTQQLAIVVNLLLVVLVLAVGIAVGRAPTPGQEVASIAPAPVSSTVVSQLSQSCRRGYAVARSLVLPVTARV